MAAIFKPTNLSLTWASGGDVLDPGAGKYAQGWLTEIPPRQWFNYLDNRQDTAIAHLNQYGVAVWDTLTEYQADKSYTQGPTNGTIYRCVLTHTGQDPEGDVTNTYWIVAFASAGDFLTEAQSDLRYLTKASNLSDLLNVATARNNLSVYSQAQTYLKSEVDAKTAVASTAQAQAWASNTTLMTPLRLAEAFKAANQSLSANGFQKLPGGLIVQWGKNTVTGDSDLNVTLPIAFTTSGYSATTAFAASADYNDSCGAYFTSNSILTLRNSSSGTRAVHWIAIGQ